LSFPYSRQFIALHHHLRIMTVQDTSYFLTWFDKELETAVVHLWQTSMSTAFGLHEVLTEIIQSTLANCVPEVVLHGCAPLPRCTPELNQVLDAFALHQGHNGQLTHVYAVLTYWPWQGGCLKCCLEKSCLSKRDCLPQIERESTLFLPLNFP
jgi:hypothetical protein